MDPGGHPVLYSISKNATDDEGPIFRSSRRSRGPMHMDGVRGPGP